MYVFVISICVGKGNLDLNLVNNVNTLNVGGGKTEKSKGNQKTLGQTLTAGVEQLGSGKTYFSCFVYVDVYMDIWIVRCHLNISADRWKQLVLFVCSFSLVFQQ